MLRYKGRKVTWTMKPDGYIDGYIEPGDNIRWGAWERTNHAIFEHDDRYQAFTLIPHASGSDYSGTLVERANYNYLWDNYSDELVQVSGGYGTFGVGFLGSAEDLSEDLQDVIAGLHEYPLADESGYSELEYETANEQWSDHGVADFRRELQSWFGNLHDDAIDEIDDTRLGLLHFEADAFHGGEWFINEQGDSIYFPFDWLTGGYHREKIGSYVLRWANEHMWPHTNPKQYFVIPDSDVGRVLADAIHDWFVPFAEVSL